MRGHPQEAPAHAPGSCDRAEACCSRCGADHHHLGLLCRNHAYNLVVRAQALQGAFQGGVHAFVRLHALSACDFNEHIAVHRAKTLRANRVAVGRLLALGLKPWQDFITFGEGAMPLGAFEWSARLGQPVVLGFFVEWLMACVSANDIETVTLYYTTDLPCAPVIVLGTIEDTTSAYVSS